MLIAALAGMLAPWAPATAAPPIARGSTPAKAGRDSVRPGDDWTFRPTVMVRRGTSQGTGTIIASVDGETLILTAAHVVRGRDRLTIELHRFNLGMENRASDGRWPRVVPAEVVATDPSADVAIIRVGKMVALPYVARMLDDSHPGELKARSPVRSLGIDQGAKLSSWDSTLVETAQIQLDDHDEDRPFLITARIPQHGRSGGGLFTADGRLIGVCVGHAEMVKGRRMGVFSSIANARRLIRDHDLTAVVARSSTRQAARRGTTAASRAERRSPALTPTESRDPASSP